MVGQCTLHKGIVCMVIGYREKGGKKNSALSLLFSSKFLLHKYNFSPSLCSPPRPRVFIILYVVCTLYSITVWSAAPHRPHCGEAPGRESNPGRRQAEKLTTRPPNLRKYKILPPSSLYLLSLVYSMCTCPTMVTILALRKDDYDLFIYRRYYSMIL